MQVLNLEGLSASFYVVLWPHQLGFNNIDYICLIFPYSSVLNRSPERLIKEIILVDDYSDNRK